jgi:hypothetical protein
MRVGRTVTDKTGMRDHRKMEADDRLTERETDQ